MFGRNYVRYHRARPPYNAPKIGGGWVGGDGCGGRPVWGGGVRRLGDQPEGPRGRGHCWHKPLTHCCFSDHLRDLQCVLRKVCVIGMDCPTLHAVGAQGGDAQTLLRQPGGLGSWLAHARCANGHHFGLTTSRGQRHTGTPLTHRSCTTQPMPPQHRATFGRSRADAPANLDRCRAQVGRPRPKLGRNRAFVCRCRPKVADLCRSCPNCCEFD